MENGNILIIEDDLALSETIATALNAKGYGTRECADSDGAVALAEAFRPNLVIIDYMLPSWNGGELCGVIKGLSGLEDVPIIIISAYSRLLFSIGDYGCDAVLEKPFDLNTLENLVKKLIGRNSSGNGLLPKIKQLLNPRK
jgi:DNA-binding response OmpR family regulator